MTRVIISGASVAGPAVAGALGRAGADVTVVEIAPSLRQGGYAVDFRGATHLGALARLGVLDPLRRQRTGGVPMRFVDGRHRTVLRLPAEFFAGDLEVLRSDLSRTLYEHSRSVARYVFDDSITSLTETADGVEVSFARSAPATFDLVIGADGIHSAVRRLAFGPEEAFVTPTGHRVAGWELPNVFELRDSALAHTVPGAMAAVSPHPHDPSRATAFCVFTADSRQPDRRDVAGQVAVLRRAFSGAGAHVARLLDTLDPIVGGSGAESAQRAAAGGWYFDAIARADVPSWSRGRIALLGDAASGATLGGMGTGTAVVGAWVLAAELAGPLLAGVDLRGPSGGAAVARAFARYEDRLRPYAAACQEGGATAGRFFAPRTRAGVAVRNRFFSTRYGRRTLLGTAEKRSTDLTLPDWPAVEQPATDLDGGRAR